MKSWGKTRRERVRQAGAHDRCAREVRLWESWRALELEHGPAWAAWQAQNRATFARYELMKPRQPRSWRRLCQAVIADAERRARKGGQL